MDIYEDRFLKVGMYGSKIQFTFFTKPDWLYLIRETDIGLVKNTTIILEATKENMLRFQRFLQQEGVEGTIHVAVKRILSSKILNPRDPLLT